MKIYYLYFLIAILNILPFNLFSQCSLTPGANTQIVTSNTVIAAGVHANGTSYLICGGVTLTFNDNLTNDTFYLEPYATLRLDSTSSYGYATIYSKSNSVFDANHRFYNLSFYEPGSILLDTAIITTGRNTACTSITYNYSNLPGATGCSTSISDLPLNDNFEIVYDAACEKISITPYLMNHLYRYELFDIAGRKRIDVLSENDFRINTYNFSHGIYFIKISQGENSFVKKIHIW